MRACFVILIAASVLARAAPAVADPVADRIKELASDRDYKVRLSAVVTLWRLGDRRAIAPLARALARDKEKSVRGAAAIALGKLVTSSTVTVTATDIVIARSALSRAMQQDGTKFVRKQAKKWHSKLPPLNANAQPLGLPGTGTPQSGTNAAGTSPPATN